MGKFKNKIVIITGAGWGVGKKSTTRLYEEGTVVSLLDPNDQNLGAVVREVNPDTGYFSTYAVDVSDSRQVTSAIDDIDKRFGRVDILVNNAGTLHKGMIENSTGMYTKLMVNVNLMGPVYCTHASVPCMKENGGNVISVSSILAIFPNTGSGAYRTAKAGMIVLTKAWVAELVPYRTRVNCYILNVLNTPMAEDVIKNRVESKLRQIPFRRFGKTDDAFDLVDSFCSDRVSYITGQTIGLDEGIRAAQTPAAAWKL